MISQIVEHLRTPLYRNGYSLVFSSIGTSGLGILYWILAARLYPTDVVGLNSAVLSAIFFLSNLSQLNLVNGLNRFLPSAGPRSRRLILGSYLANIALSVLTSAVFLLGLNFWTPSLAFVVSSPLFIVIFTLSTLAYGIFALQDSVFIGIRRAVWVPAENMAFSVLKIVLLIPFAFLIPAYGILASWLVPLAVTLLVINLLLFRRLIPAHMAANQEALEPVGTRQVASYVAYDYIGSLFWMGAAHLQPVIITQLAGPEVNAYFYLAWQIAYALFLVSRNMGSSLIAEVAAHPGKLADYSWRALTGSARLILPAVAVLVFGAPYILHLFGPEYSEEGTQLLRLLALTAIPQMIIALYLSIARIQRHMRALIFVQAATSISAVALIFVLIGPYGLTGIGLAWAISQTVVALFLVATKLRSILLANLNIGWPMKMVDLGRKLVWKWKDRERLEETNAQLPLINQALAARSGKPLAETWKAQKVIHTVSDVTVFTLGETGQPPQALLKRANSQAAIDSLQRQVRILAALNGDSRLDGWTEVLPKILAEGDVNGQYYVVEKMLPGIDAREIVQDEQSRERLLVTAADAIAELHRRTASTIHMDDRVLHHWVDERLEMVRQIKTERSPLVHFEQRIDQLAEELHQSLAGKNLAVSWIQGDYFPGNILVTRDGGQVLGIVDWDLAGEDLPVIDTMHLLLSTRILMTRRELGDIVRGLMEGSDQWTPDELELIQKAQNGLPGEPVDLRALLLLTWLRHITSNLTKTSRFATQWLWVTKNIEAVLGNL